MPFILYIVTIVDHPFIMTYLLNVPLRDSVLVLILQISVVLLVLPTLCHLFHHYPYWYLLLKPSVPYSI